MRNYSRWYVHMLTLHVNKAIILRNLLWKESILFSLAIKKWFYFYKVDNGEFSEMCLFIGEYLLVHLPYVLRIINRRLTYTLLH